VGLSEGSTWADGVGLVYNFRSHWREHQVGFMIRDLHEEVRRVKGFESSIVINRATHGVFAFLADLENEPNGGANGLKRRRRHRAR
jgi:hypothetical protein